MWCPNILSVLTPSEDSLTPIEHSLADLSVLTNSICPQNGVCSFVQVAPPWTSVAFFFVDGKMLPPLEYAVLEFHAIIRLRIILFVEEEEEDVEDLRGWMIRMTLMITRRARIICFPAYSVYSCQPTVKPVPNHVTSSCLFHPFPKLFHTVA